MTNLSMDNDLMEIFDSSHFYEEYKNILDEPLDADLKSVQKKDYVHFQKCYLITNSKIIPSNRNMSIKHLIECVYFVYTDFGEGEFDDKYWFFIGKLSNDLYFSYEVGCSGTGFGLGETCTMHFSKTEELLLTYGLTDKQRNFIKQNIGSHAEC